MDGWLSLVKGAPLEMGQCSSHSRVQIPVRPAALEKNGTINDDNTYLRVDKPQATSRLTNRYHF
jgi:hypothetical protein